MEPPTQLVCQPESAREFLVDDVLERVERLGAAEAAPVDEKRRRAVDAGFGARLKIRLDLGGVLVPAEAIVELRRVERQLRRVPLQVVVGQTPGTREEAIVVRPELALLGGAGGRLG